MDICAHCHNVLSKNVQRCTVCGTARVDPAAADVRRSEGDRPSHAPGWAAPAVKERGLHPDDFLRELSGEDPAPPRASEEPPTEKPVLPPRATPITPAPGALAGYLGAKIHREPVDEQPETLDAPPISAPSPLQDDPLAEQPAPAKHFGQHLSTATNVTADGVAARTTRLDGTVKLGPTNAHRSLVLGAPLLGALILLASIAGAYGGGTVPAQESTAQAEAEAIETSAITRASSAVVRLDLDGCGIIDQTTGFLFADQSILVARSSILTDNRPTVVRSDGSTHASEVVGWSQVRNVAVVRTDMAQAGGLSWGVSARVREGDTVSVLAVTGPGIAAPVPATIVQAKQVNGVNMSFVLDVRAAEGSIVLDSNGFAIGVFDDQNLALASDDVAPAVSRIRLADERPPAECPPPPTIPSTTVAADDETESDADDPNRTEDTAPEE